MKNQVEDHLPNETGAAEALRRQLAEREAGKSPALQRGRKNPLLIPFLLSIPVILIAAILAISWSRETEKFQPVAMERAIPPRAENEPTLSPGQGRTVYASFQPAEIVPQGDTVVKSRRWSRGNTAARQVSFQSERLAGINSIEQMVMVQPDYRVEDGSIRDLRFNIANVSPAVLDLVVVEVTFLNAANQAVKKETLYLKDIAASKDAFVPVPDSGHSGKLAYKVSLVSAKDANLYLVSR